MYVLKCIKCGYSKEVLFENNKNYVCESCAGLQKQLNEY